MLPSHHRVEDYNASESIRQVIKENLPSDREIVFLCIGTDRITGDSFGPMVGTFLQDKKIPNVFGTLEHPVHATNLDERIKQITNSYANPFVVAIDSSLGKLSSVGNLILDNKAIKPGAGVGKDLPEVGDFSIMYAVNVAGYMEHLVLSNTRLSMVWKGATLLSEVLCSLNNANEGENMSTEPNKGKNLYLSVSPTGNVRSANKQEIRIARGFTVENDKLRLYSSAPRVILKNMDIPNDAYVDSGSGDIFHIVNICGVIQVCNIDITNNHISRIPSPGLWRIPVGDKIATKLRGW